MKIIPFLLLIFAVSSFNNLVVAQDKNCYICSAATIHQLGESPYKKFSFKNECPTLASAIGLSITSQLLKSPKGLTINDITELDKNDINRFDRYATLQNSGSAKMASDIVAIGALALPALFLSNQSTRKDLFPLAVMTAEVVIINYAITDIVKKIVKRTRPLAYNSTFNIEDKLDKATRRSFISGHTSNTAALSFFIAQVIKDYHPTAQRGVKIGVWTFAATIPAVTGYLRVKAGKHFPTDVITGYIAGGLVGWLVPQFHKKEKTSKKVSFTPHLGIGYASLSMRF